MKGNIPDIPAAITGSDAPHTKPCCVSRAPAPGRASLLSAGHLPAGSGQHKEPRAPALCPRRSRAGRQPLPRAAASPFRQNILRPPLRPRGSRPNERAPHGLGRSSRGGTVRISCQRLSLPSCSSRAARVSAREGSVQRQGWMGL